MSNSLIHYYHRLNMFWWKKVFMVINGKMMFNEADLGSIIFRRLYIVIAIALKLELLTLYERPSQ